MEDGQEELGKVALRAPMLTAPYPLPFAPQPSYLSQPQSLL